MSRVRRLRDDARELFRRAVLDAAEEVFAEHGYHRARIQDIAARARVAVGTIYNHFEQKEDVLAALLVERGNEVHGEFLRRPDDPPAFEPQFRARFGRVVAFLGRHRDFFRIAADLGVLGEGAAGPSSPFVKIHREQEQRMGADIAELLEQGIREGALAQAPVALLGRFFSGALKYVLMGRVQEGGDVAADAEWALDLFLRGAKLA